MYGVNIRKHINDMHAVYHRISNHRLGYDAEYIACSINLYMHVVFIAFGIAFDIQ